MLNEVLFNKINGHYKDIAIVLNTSEWEAEQIIRNNGKISIKMLEKLFDYLGIELNVLDKEIKYELSTEINKKTFRNYAGYWLLQKKYEIKESTYSNYVNILDCVILPVIGDIPCENFNNRLLQQFAYYCKECGGKNKKGLSEHYIRDCLLIIKSIIKSGQEEQVFPEFLIKQIKIPKNHDVVKKKKETFTNEEFKKIIKFVKENIDYRNLGILIGIFTGARIGEICGLKWEDIDFEKKSIHINKTVQRIYSSIERNSKIVISSPKTKNSIRDIPLSNELSSILKQMKTSENNFILSNKDVPLEPRTFRKHYERILAKCEIQFLKFHTLRHTFASLNIENGIDVETVKELLGHSDIKTTLGIYTHTTEKSKKKAIDKFYKLVGEEL